MKKNITIGFLAVLSALSTTYALYQRDVPDHRLEDAVEIHRKSLDLQMKLEDCSEELQRVKVLHDSVISH